MSPSDIFDSIYLMTLPDIFAFPLFVLRFLFYVYSFLKQREYNINVATGEKGYYTFSNILIYVLIITIEDRKNVFNVIQMEKS